MKINKIKVWENINKTNVRKIKNSPVPMDTVQMS